MIATAEPGPETLLFARERWGVGIEFAVTSKFDIVWAVQTAFADSLSHRAVYELAELNPEMSAQAGVYISASGRLATRLLTLLMLGSGDRRRSPR